MIEINTETLVVMAIAIAGFVGQWATNKKTVSTLEKKVESLEAFDRVTNSEYHELNRQLAVLTNTVDTLSLTVRELVAEVRGLREK